MKIEHKYFVVTQQGEKNNVAALHKLMSDGWTPARETPMKASTGNSNDEKSRHECFSHCLILLYREIK